MKAQFTVLGEPRGKGRPRFSKVGPYVRPHTPEDTASYENLIQVEFRRQCGDVFWEAKTPVKIIIIALYGVPASTSKKKRAEMLDRIVRPTKKPDADNLVKVVMDALNHVAWYDDAQVVDIDVRKYYGEQPLIKIVIEDAEKLNLEE